MITNLLTAICITASIGANLYNFNNEKPQAPKNNLIQDYSLTINKQQRTTQTTDTTTEFYLSYAQRVSANNTAITVIGNYYSQFKQVRANNQGNTQTMQTGEDSMKMMIYAITPYENTADNEIEIKLNTTIYERVISQYVAVNLYLNQQIYIAQENWSQYIDVANYGTVGILKNIKQEITSPASGYRYQTITQQQQLITNTGGNTQQVTFENNLTITKNITTYVVMFYYITGTYNGGQDQLEFVEIESWSNVFDTDTPPQKITGKLIIAEGTQEIVDIPGMMFYILTMPFTFISGAFDLTLFPGTPYQLNISNLFMAIIAVMAFIFILKILIKLKGGAG